MQRVKHFPRQIAVTFTDSSHYAFAGGDATRRTVIIDLTEDQMRLMSVEKDINGLGYEEISQITPVYPSVPSTPEQR